MRVLITRPVEDAEPLASRLRGLGIASLIEPLMSIRVLPGAAFDLRGVQAILATSANGVRAFVRRASRRDIPLFAVGDATATAARDAGFTHVDSAGGDVIALAGRVRKRLDPSAGPLLHVAGSVVARDLSRLLQDAGFACRRAVLYEARPAKSLSPATVRAIRAGELGGVLFFSPRTAEVFVRLARKAQLMRACRRLAVFALSPAVAAKAAPISWRDCRVAATPNQDALLALLAAWRAPLKNPSTYGRS